MEFLQKILELAGIPDENPTFVWNKVANQTEQTNMVMSAANYLSDEMIIKHLPFLTPEEAEEVIKQRENEGYSSFNQPQPDQNDEPDEDEKSDDQNDNEEDEE